MLTELQKRTIQAIVNVFETGKAAGDYANVTLLPGDAGHLTYGRSQTTLATGNLYQLVENYCAAAVGEAAKELRAYLPRLDARDTSLDSDAQFRALLCAAAVGEAAKELRAYLPRLDARDTSLDSDAQFRALLRHAGSDPAMQRAQDEFFDRAYWQPALLAAQRVTIQTPLGTAVVYDSFIHGAWARLRDATTARVGLPSPSGGAATATDERAWVRQYVALRREWLAGHPNPVLRRAVYRMDTFAALIAAENWPLALPVVAHGVSIDEGAVAATSSAQPVPQLRSR